MNKNLSRTLAFAVCLAFLACSARKKESPEASSTPSGTDFTVEIKPFQSVSANAKSGFNGFLDGYFAINEMLINDSLPGARQAAENLKNAIKKFEMADLTAEQMDFYILESSAVKLSLAGIAQSEDIEVARGHFVALSRSMYALVKAFHPNSSPIYYQYCPMADEGRGANWLSDKKAISNPYMGQMMPECGRNKEILD